MILFIIGAVGCGPQEEFRGCADITIGDNVPALPPSPKKKVPAGRGKPQNIPTDNTWIPNANDTIESKANYWYFSFIIAGTSLLVVVAAFALLYGYYYHAGRAKQWLMARRRVGEQQNLPVPPIAPPRQKRLSSSNLYL